MPLRLSLLLLLRGSRLLTAEVRRDRAAARDHESGERQPNLPCHAAFSKLNDDRAYYEIREPHVYLA